MLENNKENVKIAFKNLPLTSIHDMAEAAALAGLAAHKQGKFWQMHDELFAMDTITQAKIVEGYQPVMPTYSGILKDKEIDALVMYLKSLK